MSIKTMIANYESSLQSICFKVAKGEKNVESALREIERLHDDFSDMLVAISSFGGLTNERVSVYMSTIALHYEFTKKDIEKYKNKRYNKVYDANIFDGIENTYIIESEEN